MYVDLCVVRGTNLSKRSVFAQKLEMNQRRIEFASAFDDFLADIQKDL